MGETRNTKYKNQQQNKQQLLKYVKQRLHINLNETTQNTIKELNKQS